MDWINVQCSKYKSLAVQKMIWTTLKTFHPNISDVTYVTSEMLKYYRQESNAGYSPRNTERSSQCSPKQLEARSSAETSINVHPVLQNILILNLPHLLWRIRHNFLHIVFLKLSHLVCEIRQNHLCILFIDLPHLLWQFRHNHLRVLGYS